MGETITLTTADGAVISAYRARPSGTPKGGIVVVQEIFGVNHHIRAVADKFAAAGYLAVAPAIFDRVEKNVELAYDADGIARGFALAQKSPTPAALQDIAAAAAVAAEGGKVGVVGFCWGGSLAYASAAHPAGAIAAAVGYYGGNITKDLRARLHVPVELHFGAKDDYIPLSDVELIGQTHPDVAIYVYDAGHGFNCDERGSYDKASADLAWSRTLKFFGEHLR
ncbi:MAG: dienelactone hydrolase family protein [Beijerinckiaceae bacterium]|jgi:carboxymethylenebutenolidase